MDRKTLFIQFPLVVVVITVLFGWAATSCRQQTPMIQNSSVSIDHVALHVADLDVSVAFYSGVFGLEEIPAASAGRRWLSLGKGVAVHLLGGRTEPVADNRSVHLALTSE